MSNPENSARNGQGMRPNTPVPYPKVNGVANANANLRAYFNRVRRGGRYMGVESFNNLSKNQLNRLISNMNRTGGKISSNTPSAPLMPTNGKATVVNPMNGKVTTGVPIVTLEGLAGNVNILKKKVKNLENRSGLGGAALATLETGGRGAVAGAKAAGKGVMYIGKGVGTAAGYVGSGIVSGAQAVGRTGTAFQRGTRGYSIGAMKAYHGYFNNYRKRQAIRPKLVNASSRAWNSRNNHPSLVQLQREGNMNLIYLRNAGITKNANIKTARSMYKGYLSHY